MSENQDGRSDSLRMIYDALRNEIMALNGRVDTIRGWSVLLVGAAVAYSLEVLTSDVEVNAVIKRPAVVVTWTLVVASLINVLVLWLIIMLRRSIVRMGAFLWKLEEELDLERGWEQWVAYRDIVAKKEYFTDILGETQTWIAGVFVVIAGIFSLYVHEAGELRWFVVGGCVLLMLVCVAMSIWHAGYRRRAYGKLLRDMKESDDWVRDVRQRLRIT